MSHPIPQPPGLPLVGNVFNVKPSNTWASLMTLAEKYGEIFQIKVFGKTLVFVSGAALVEELCDERRFRKFVGGPIVEIRYAVNDALFTAYDDEPSWGVAHRICAPRLSRDAVAQWCGEMVDVAEELVAKWTGGGGGGGGGGGAAGRGHGVLLIDELNRLSLEATTLTLFGKKLGCIAAAAPHPMLAGMEDATSEAMKRPTRLGLVNTLFFGRKFRNARKAMRDYAEDLVRHRQQQQQQGEGQGAAAGGRADLLAALMEGTDPQTGRALTESQVVDEIVSMPIGSSTAPCVVASAVYFLLRNPACLAAARRELDEVLGPWSARKKAEEEEEEEEEAGGKEGKGTGTNTTNTTNAAAGAGAHRTGLRPEHLPRLRYVEGVVREALRLSCAAPGFNVEPVPRATASGARDEAPVLLGGGRYRVAHDQAMVVVLSRANRDLHPGREGEEGGEEEEDPRAFRPERCMTTTTTTTTTSTTNTGASGPGGWAADDADLEGLRLPAGSRKWYGNGKRECIGRHWARQFCVAAVAVLLREVDFEMVDPAYELAQDGWFNLRPVGFRVRARPRGG